jgi:hypothetical protein
VTTHTRERALHNKPHSQKVQGTGIFPYLVPKIVDTFIVENKARIDMVHQMRHRQHRIV